MLRKSLHSLWIRQKSLQSHIRGIDVLFLVLFTLVLEWSYPKRCKGREQHRYREGDQPTEYYNPAWMETIIDKEIIEELHFGEEVSE